MNAKITIRVAKPQDAEKLLTIYAPYVEKTAISFEYEVPTIEEFAGRIRNTLKKYPYFVAEADGEIVGYAYAGDFHTRAAFQRCVETSIYIRENVRGMGIGAALYAKLEHSLKAMGILNMNASIASTPTEDEYLTNASERFHERMGFVKTAEFHQCGYKFKRWYNLIWMEKMIGEHAANPVPIKRFLEVLPMKEKKMILREYQSSDCKEMAELFYNTVHNVNAKDYTQEQLDVWATGQVDLEGWNQSFREHYSVVAVLDEIIVGFGDIDETGYLDRLYVHKDYQRQGVATAICDKLEQAVQGKIVTHASITARPFFEKRGYKVIKEQQVERQGIFLTNFIMEKD